MEKAYLTLEEIKDKIHRDKPRLVFITGKTCAGKSTLAKSIKDYEYEHLELDFLVEKNVADKFKIIDRSKAFLVYKGEAPRRWQKFFEEVAHKVILQKIKISNVVVDAAIANTDVLKKIFSGDLSDFLFIYLHPLDVEFYYKSILSRFEDDVKNNKHSFPIWGHINSDILNDYKKNGKSGIKIARIIHKYGDESIVGSIKRFENFKKEYPDIVLTGH
jgi:adenylate kinase family enzyme